MTAPEETPGNGHRDGLEVCVDQYEGALRELAQRDPQRRWRWPKRCLTGCGGCSMTFRLSSPITEKIPGRKAANLPDPFWTPTRKPRAVCIDQFEQALRALANRQKSSTCRAAGRTYPGGLRREDSTSTIR